MSEEHHLSEDQSFSEADILRQSLELEARQVRADLDKVREKIEQIKEEEKTGGVSAYREFVFGLLEKYGLPVDNVVGSREELNVLESHIAQRYERARAQL